MNPTISDQKLAVRPVNNPSPAPLIGGTETGQLIILVGEVLDTSVESDIFRDGVATVNAEK